MATGRLPDPNTAPVTAKGDLYTYSTVPAKLAVGNNGETLVADSSATTGLRYTGLFGGNKNKILNGDFEINQRAFTSNTTNGTYNFDRWYQQNSGGTTTITPQNFTAGSAPVAGYEGRQFCQVVTASQSAAGDYAQLTQAIEDVRTLAGQTATISFWAKATSGTPKISVEVIQRFGSGGSPSADVQTYAGQVTISTSWARYSITVAVPSISGKTVGTTVNTSSTTWSFWLSAGTNFNARTGSLGVQNNTFQIWGVQVEAGSVATPFQTATGTLAGELAACQRYYVRFSGSNQTSIGSFGSAASTTTMRAVVPLPATMRVAPTAIDSGGLFWAYDGTNTITVGSFSFYNSSVNLPHISATGTGLTQFRPYVIIAQNDSTAYVGFSAEL